MRHSWRYSWLWQNFWRLVRVYCYVVGFLVALGVTHEALEKFRTVLAQAQQRRLESLTIRSGPPTQDPQILRIVAADGTTYDVPYTLSDAD